MVEDVKPGGVFLLNCSWNTEELEEHLPGQVKTVSYTHLTQPSLILTLIPVGIFIVSPGFNSNAIGA